jgi:hypothetical protein
VCSGSRERTEKERNEDGLSLSLSQILKLFLIPCWLKLQLEENFVLLTYIRSVPSSFVRIVPFYSGFPPRIQDGETEEEEHHEGFIPPSSVRNEYHNDGDDDDVIFSSRKKASLS